LYWDAIVANNSYHYVSALSGDGAWTDATHWVHDMDPNYGVIRDGELVNDLPDTPALGTDPAATNFGGICFLDECVDMRNVGPGEDSTGPGLIVANGPGTTGFVPDNVEPDPNAAIRAAYYDVMLSAPGTTWLDSDIEIDRFGMSNGQATLDVQSGGSLSIL